MLYFAFGSNMNLERMKSRKTNFEFRSGGVLHNYKLTFNKKAGFSYSSSGSLFPRGTYAIGKKTLWENKSVILSSGIDRKPEHREAEEGYANVVPSEGDYVEGVLYVIPREGLKRLDICEGVPTHYQREVLPIVCPNGITVDAIVYVANVDKEEDNLLPSDKYLSHLLKGRDLLSDEYFKKLATQKTISEFSNNGYSSTYNNGYPGYEHGGYNYDDYDDYNYYNRYQNMGVPIKNEYR